MKFFEYLDIIYVNKNISLQVDGYDLKVQAESRAIPVLMDRQRAYFRTIAYFKLIFGYYKAKFTGVWPTRREMPIQQQQPLKAVNDDKPEGA